MRCQQDGSDNRRVPSYCLLQSSMVQMRKFMNLFGRSNPSASGMGRGYDWGEGIKGGKGRRIRGGSMGLGTKWRMDPWR